MSLIKDRAGKPTGSVAVNRDIGERKRAEAALQRYADRLQQLRAIDQAMLVNQPFTVIAQNALVHVGHLIPSTRVSLVLIDTVAETIRLAALQLHGALQPTPTLQLPLAVIGPALAPLLRGEIFYAPDLSALPELSPAMQAIQSEQVRTYAVVPIMAAGELVAALNVGSDKVDAFSAEHLEIAGEVAAQLSIAIQQSGLREQIAQHAEELEQRVVARTAELATANKELEAFSYSVSHDLRSPLRAIDGFSRILLDEYEAELPEEARGHLQRVRSSAQQMGRLIDDLLAFARLGRQTVARRRVDPAELVRQCLIELHDEQAGREVRFVIGELPLCQADPALLKQVWVNLLANALKYTRHCELAKVEIGSRQEQRAVVYYVQDNGVGFDMRYSSKLFGVFQRLHRADEYEGTGVGLAIVQRIVHRHGGRVWADAAVGEGATFFFTLGEHDA